MRRQLKLGPDIAIGEASQAVFSVHDRLEQFGIVMGQRIETGAAAAGGILLACGDTLQIAFGVGAHSDKPADILNRSRLEIRLFTDGSPPGECGRFGSDREHWVCQAPAYMVRSAQRQASLAARCGCPVEIARPSLVRNRIAAVRRACGRRPTVRGSAPGRTVGPIHYLRCS